MFAVIRHTYIITKDKPDNESSNEYTGTWKHYAFLCMNKAEAMAVAVHLLHDPLLSVSDFVLDNAIKQLEDRFGKVPDEIFTLCDALRLRWLGKQIGFERVILKDDKMRAYFTSKADSPYYNSSSFNLVLNYLKSNFENCKMIEIKGKLSLRISNISTLKEVLVICNSILER